MIEYIRLLRPKQWLKNLMLFFPPFLGGVLLDFKSVAMGMIPFGCFCLASSATYVINDLVDADRDAKHPEKKTRPVASGAVSSLIAGLLAIILTGMALFFAWRISLTFFIIMSLYASNSLIYSLIFKQLPLFDLFSISAGFFASPVSRWRGLRCRTFGLAVSQRFSAVLVSQHW